MKKIVILLILTVTSWNTCAADKPVKTIEVALRSPLEVEKTKDTSAIFHGLTEQAIKIGMHNSVLLGKVTYSSMGAGKTRVKINWHSLQLEQGQRSGVETLSNPLMSQFTTTDKRVEPNTAFQAQGNINKAVESYQVLAAKMNEDKTPRHLVSKSEDKEVKTEKTTSNLNPGSGSSGSSKADPASTSTSDLSANTSLVISRWEDCTPRIDLSNKMVFSQQRIIEETDSGQVLSTGACQDYGNGAPIEKTYGACDPIIDQTDRKAFKQYTEAATLNGILIKVAGCTMDESSFFDILATYENCGVRHDFTLGRSIQQEQLYYISGADRIDILECQDSSVVYPHYLTTNTCTPVIDATNGLVFIQKRTAYDNLDGTTAFASECRAATSAGVAIQEEICANKYEHDFVAGQSYLRTRDYYLDDKNVVQYISECSRSTLISFEHLYSPDGCPVINDDSKLMTTWQSNAYIDTPDDGIMVLEACTQRGNPTPYVFLDTLSTTTTKTFPENTQLSINGFMEGLGTPSSCTGTYSINCSTFVSSLVDACAFPTTAVYGCVIESTPLGTNNIKTAVVRDKVEGFNQYLRGDGTTYNKLMTTNYAIHL